MVAITQIVVAGLMTVAANALPQPQAAQPSATPAPAAAPPANNTELFKDLFTAPTAIKKFQRLLTTGESQTLLTGEALRKLTVFDFNEAKPAAGAKGGATLAAVSSRLLYARNLGLTYLRTSSRSPSSLASASRQRSVSSSHAASTLLTCILVPPSSSLLLRART